MYNNKQIIELKAAGAESKSQIHKFNRNIEIEITFDPQEIGVDHSALWLYWYDETNDIWLPVPCDNLSEPNKLKAYVDHFSLFSLAEQNWERVRIPALDAAQVSSFTGSASYSYSIDVPAGPGGIRPSVGLSYNSQSVEGANQQTQASWVGLGWSLSAGGSISRNRGLLLDDVKDDTYSMVVGGQSFQLIPVGQGTDASGRNYIDYKASSDNFWKFRRYLLSSLNGYRYENDCWVVWDKIGTKYIFDKRAYYLEVYGNDATMRPWSWYLTTMTNAAGQSITYTYEFEREVKCYRWDGSINSCGFAGWTEISAYLSTIVYGSGHYTIRFNRAFQRTDFDFSWFDEASYFTFLTAERQNLDSIEVLIDNNVVKKYNLTYYVIEDNDKTPPTPIFPRNSWTPEEDKGRTGKALVLKSIQEFGGTASMPAVTFTYGEYTLNGSSYNIDDFMHLSQVDNGVGGKVSFEYEAIPWAAMVGSDKQKISLRSGYVDSRYPIKMLNSSSEQIPIRPGGAYLFSCKFSTNTPGSQVVFYTNSYHEGVLVKRDVSPRITVNAAQWYSAVITIPSKPIDYMNVHVNWAEGGAVDFAEGCKFVPAVYHYRVVKKIISDGLNTSGQVFTYEYEGAAVNDTEHSDYAKLTNTKSEANTEFRGHRKVRMADPYGLVTDTYFFQDDRNQGMVQQVNQYQNNAGIFTLLSTTLNTYGYVGQTGDDNISYCARETAECFKDREVNWVYQRTEALFLYNEDGITRHGTFKEYSYLTADQGGVQYGNLTRVKESMFINGSTEKVPFRITQTGYTTSVNLDGNKYLVGLPAYENVYQWSTLEEDYRVSRLVASTCYMYVDPDVSYPCSLPHTSSGLVSLETKMVSSGMTSGLLRGKRVLLRLSNGTYGYPYYRDEQYDYDQWGNQTAVTAYKNEGTIGNFDFASGVTSTICYGKSPLETGGKTAPECVDDGYRVFPAWQVDGEGNITSMQFDRIRGVMVKEEDANGGVTTAGYDDFGRMLWVRRPLDETGTPSVSIEYNLSARPYYVKVTNKIDTTTTVSRRYFDGLGRLVQTQAASNVDGSLQDVIVNYKYNAYGSVVEQSIPVAVANNNNRAYCGSGCLPSPIYWTKTEYDVLGRVTKAISPDGTATTTSYAVTANSLITTVTGPDNHATTSTADPFGRVTLVQAPDNLLSTNYQYDVLGRLVQTYQNASYPTTITYDLGGRKTKMVDPDMGTWNYGYDALGNLVSQKDNKNQQTCLYYDGLARLTTKYYTAASSTCETSDSLNLAARSVVNGYDGTFYQDPFDGSALSADWTTGGGTVSGGKASITGSGNFARSAYAIKPGYGAQFTFQIANGSDRGILMIEKGTYLAAGYRRASIEIANGKMYLVTYVDGTRSPLQFISNISANTWYQARISLLSETSFRIEVWETANPAKRGIINGSFASASPLSGNWRGKVNGVAGTISVDAYEEIVNDHNMTQTYMRDGSGSSIWFYDIRGRRLQEVRDVTGAGRFITRWEYNSADWVTAMRYPADNAGGFGERVAYTYYPQGSLNTMAGSYDYVKGSWYDAVGRLASRSMNATGSLLATYSYYPWLSGEGPGNSNGRLERVELIDHAAGKAYLDLIYNYNIDGNIHTIIRPGDVLLGQANDVETFEYDQLDRLTSAKAEGGASPYTQQDFAYDSDGRLTSSVQAGKTKAYNYHYATPPEPPVFEPFHAVKELDGSTFIYDGNGNQIQQIKNSVVTRELTYDAENRLTQGEKDGQQINYTYDGAGAMVTKTAGGVTTVYIGGYFEWSGSTATMKKYYAAGGQVIAMRVGSGTGLTGLTWLAADHLGSTSVMINAADGTSSEIRYAPWGETRYTTPNTPIPTDRKYTGQREESALGLYFYNARWYDPSIMQFQQPDTLVPDPYNALDWNRYAYARYNPVKYTDPSGHAVRSDTDENGCSGQGPSCIIDMYGYDAGLDDSLEAWYLQHPGYDPNLDPTLEETDHFTVASAISRARCDGGSKWDCATILIIASMASYGMTGMGPDGPIGNTPGPNKNFVKDTIGDPDCPGCGYFPPPIVAGRGHSKGRVEPSSLKEKLAMEQVQSDPLKWGVARPKVPMTDPRWLGSEGWIKYSANINGVEIHFVYNPTTWQVDDFKFPIQQ